MVQQYHRKADKSKDDSLEVKVVIGVLRGLVWLVTWPFRARNHGSKPRVPKRASGSVDVLEVTRRWGDIQTTIGLGGVAHFGSSIVAADKLLDYVLRQKGYSGDTMGERLRSAESDVSRGAYQAAWQAHKLRNQLVHEMESEVLSFQAKEALQNYEIILRELGALR